LAPQPDRYGVHFVGRERAGDVAHRPARIVAALGQSPALELLARIGLRLAGQGGLTAADALPGLAMAGGAGRKAARGITLAPQRRRGSHL
jgi:hypothetical protein